SVREVTGHGAGEPELAFDVELEPVRRRGRRGRLKARPHGVSFRRCQEGDQRKELRAHGFLPSARPPFDVGIRLGCAGGQAHDRLPGAGVSWLSKTPFFLDIHRRPGVPYHAVNALATRVEARLAAETGAPVRVLALAPLAGGACQDLFEVELDVGP